MEKQLTEDLGLTTRFAETEKDYAKIRNSIIGEIHFVYDNDEVWYKYKDICYVLDIIPDYVEYLECVSHKNCKTFHKGINEEIFLNNYGLVEIFDLMPEQSLPKIMLLCRITKKHIEDYYNAYEHTPAKATKPSEEWKPKKRGRKRFHLYIQEDLFDSLRTLAEYEEQSINSYIVGILKSYVEGEISDSSKSRDYPAENTSSMQLNELIGMVRSLENKVSKLENRDKKGRAELIDFMAHKAAAPHSGYIPKSQISPRMRKEICDFYNRSKKNTFALTAKKFGICLSTAYDIVTENKIA